MDKYKELEKALLDLGYKSTSDEDDFWFMEGPCWLGFAVDQNLARNICVIGKVCADNADTFGKYKDCLIQVPVPNTEQERNVLLYVLKLLGTPAGELLSVYSEEYDIPDPARTYDDLHKLADALEQEIAHYDKFYSKK